LDSYKDDTTFENLPEFQKAFMWQSYFEPLRKEWHKNHSLFNREESRWMPNDDYINSDYSQLSTETKQLIGELMDIKYQLDGLTGNAMPSRRAP